MKYFVAVIAVLFCVFHAHGIVLEEYEDCAGNGNLVSVDVDNCDEEPCVFSKGDQLKAKMRFVADESTDKLKLSVRAFIGNVWIPFPGLKTDVCQDYGLPCPLQKGKEYTLEIQIKILPFYPSLNTNTVWKIIAGDRDMVCFQTQVEIE